MQKQWAWAFEERDKYTFIDNDVLVVQKSSEHGHIEEDQEAVKHEEHTYFWVVIALIFLIGVGIHVNTWNHGFVFDDARAIADNRDVLNPNRTLIQIFSDDFWGIQLSSPHSCRSYRPLTVLTFRWNHFMVGELNSAVFHITNTLMHGLASALVLILAALVLPSAMGAIFAALLFATHPIHTESVDNNVGRAEVQGLIFFVWAYLLHAATNQNVFIHCHNVFRTKGSWWTIRESHLRSRRDWSYIIPAILLSICSALSKELGFILPATVFIREMLAGKHRKMYACVPYFIGSGAIIYFRWWMQNGVLGMDPEILEWNRENNSYALEPPIPRILTRSYIHVRYLWLLVYPVWLNCDYSAPTFPLIQSFTDPRNLVTVFGYAIVILGTLYFFYLTFVKQDPYGAAALWSALWGLVTFLPASGLLFHVGTVIGERLLYTPSLGWCFLITSLVCRTCAPPQGGSEDTYKKQKRLSNYGIGFLSALVVFYGVRTWIRNPVWSDPVTLWESALLTQPGSHRPYGALGQIYTDSGRHNNRTIDLLIKSLDMYPNCTLSYQSMTKIETHRQNWTGVIYWARGCLKSAPPYVRKTPTLCAHHGCVAANKVEKWDTAIEFCTTCIEKNRTHPGCHWQKGQAYLHLEDYNKAAAYMQNAARIMGDKKEGKGAWRNAALLRLAVGAFDECDWWISEAEKRNPGWNATELWDHCKRKEAVKIKKEGNKFTL